MGKLSALFGGRDEQDEGSEAEASAAEEAPQPEPPSIPDTQPVYVQTNPYASIDDYAASLPAPDYVDPAGKASARSEAA